jgi:hypothetical protein
VVVLDGSVDPLGGAAFVVAEVFGEVVSDQTLALSTTVVFPPDASYLTRRPLGGVEYGGRINERSRLAK